MIMTRLSGRKGRARQPPLSIPLNCRTFAEVDMKIRTKTSIVCGVAINDSEYPVIKKETVNGRRFHVWTCPYYKTWQSMITRCYCEKTMARHRTYDECYVAPEWLRFSVFREWMKTKDWQGKELDKDVLVPGNKVYSPETCAFISSPLNHFLIDRKAGRGKHPLGVYWNKQRNKFEARCSDPFIGKQVPLGRFHDAQDAHMAWKRKKHEIACKYADMQTDERLAEALRSRFA